MGNPVQDTVRTISQKDLKDPALWRVNRRFSDIEQAIQNVNNQIPDGVPTPLSAPLSATTNLTGSLADMPGMGFQLTRAGWWRIDIAVVFSCDKVDGFCEAYLVADGTVQPGSIQASANGNGVSLTLPGSRPWLYQSPAGNEVVKARAWKTAGAGASTVAQGVITAVWVSP